MNGCKFSVPKVSLVTVRIRVEFVSYIIKLDRVGFVRLLLIG